jgi:hypothetical protein
METPDIQLQQSIQQSLYATFLSQGQNTELQPEQIALNEAYEREVFLPNLRLKRNQILSKTDWTQLVDSPLSEEKKQEYIVYRQNLRDLPSSATYDNLIWPTEPS